MITKRRIFKASVIRALGSLLLLVGDTFATMVFLANYSADKLPYLFLASVLVTAPIMYLVMPYIKSNLRGFIKWSHGIFILLLLPFFYLLREDYFAAPFIFAVLVAFINVVVNANYWDLATSFF